MVNSLCQCPKTTDKVYNCFLTACDSRLMSSLERFVLGGKAKMHSLQWQLKSYWSATSPFFGKGQVVHQMVAARGEVGIKSPSPGAPSISSPILWCISDGLESASTGCDCCRDMNLPGELTPMSMYWRWRQFHWCWMPFYPRLWGDFDLSEWYCHSSGLYIEARGAQYFWTLANWFWLLLTSQNCTSSITHPDMSLGSRTLSRISQAILIRFFPWSGPFFPRCSTLSAKSMAILILICSPPGQIPCFSCVLPSPDSLAWKEDYFQYQWNTVSIFAFPQFSFQRQILWSVQLSHNFSLILIACFGHRRIGLQIFWLFCWKNLSNSLCCGISSFNTMWEMELSSYASAKPSFLRRFQSSLLQTSKVYSMSVPGKMVQILPLASWKKYCSMQKIGASLLFRRNFSVQQVLKAGIWSSQTISIVPGVMVQETVTH